MNISSSRPTFQGLHANKSQLKPIQFGMLGNNPNAQAIRRRYLLITKLAGCLTVSGPLTAFGINQVQESSSQANTAVGVFSTAVGMLGLLSVGWIFHLKIIAPYYAEQRAIRLARAIER